MAKHYRYHVKTVCTATVTEAWTVESDRPLTPEQLDDVVVSGELDGADVPDTVTFSCGDEEISDEHDRSVMESYQLDEEEIGQTPAGYQKRVGVEVGCGKAECRDCYEAVLNG